MKTLFIFLVAATGLISSARGQTFFHGFAASRNAPLTFNIDAFIGNRYPVEPLTVAPVGDASLGSLKLLPNEEATFTPGPKFPGEASFNYSITIHNPPGTLPATEISTGVLTFVDFALFQGNYLLVNDQSGKGMLPATGMLTVTASGSATVRDGVMSGAAQFDKTGGLAKTVGGYPDGIFFHLSVSNGTPVISGGFGFGDPIGYYSVDATAVKILPAGANAGRYSVLMQPVPVNAAGGTGWATMKVTAAGQISYVGQLNDGTAFSATSGVTTGGAFPLDINYKLTGSATFRDTPGASDFDGSFTQLIYSTQNPNGTLITLPLSFIGSRFIPANSKTHLLKYSKQTGTATLTFTSGDLTAPVTATATIAPGEAVKAVKAPLKALTLWAYDSPVFGNVGGIFSGQFMDPAAKAIRYFRGVTFQKQNIAAGVFRGAVPSNAGPANYGTVTLTPQ